MKLYFFSPSHCNKLTFFKLLYNINKNSYQQLAIYHILHRKIYKTKYFRAYT